jgi:predicted permease
MVAETYQDLRYALRMLVKNPGFTAVAVLTLALGIGANTAVFTLINAVLLRTLPVSNPRELVELNTAQRGGQGIISFPMYRDLRARQQVLTDIFASAGETPIRLTIPNGSESVELDNIRTGFVTANYFGVLGLQPAAGRFFTEEEDLNPNSSETAGSVAVISDALWERQFGRDPSVLNRTVLVTRSACRIVGVAPPGFRGEAIGNNTDIWVPLISFSSSDNLKNRRGVFTSYMGRLRPGVSQSQAQAALTVLFQQLVEAERIQSPQKSSHSSKPLSVQDFSILLASGATGFDHGVRRTFTKPLWIIMAIVALVLFIACANVANLLLSRAAARRREISVRLALGCNRLRLIRQLLTESLLLAMLGTIAGVAFAYWASPLLMRLIATGPFSIPLDLRPDGLVLAFLAAIAIITGLGFGIAPAWQASNVDLTSALKNQGRAGTGKRTRQYLGRTLVIVQVALSLLLLVGASLLIRSFRNLRQIDLGFRPEQVLIFDLAHNAQDRKPEAMARVAREVRERVTQIPGVQSASVSGLMLFSPSDINAPIRIQDNAASQREPIPVRFSSVSAGFFETVGMTIVQGRAIEQHDSENGPLVAVINELMARRYFPEGSPLGRTFEIPTNWRSPFEASKGKPIEIVGVVRDAKYNDLRVDVKPMFYLPILQMPRSLRSLEVRTAEPSAVLAGRVRSELLGVTKDLMIRRVIPLSDQVDRTLAGERMITTLCSFFGVLALLLASVGLYGVISYAVSQRTNEIGIRMALGATGRSVMTMVLRQGLIVVLAGLAIGLLLAVMLTRLVSSFLFGVSPLDPLSLGLATALLILVAAFAVLFPARRATKVDPLVALRYE